MVQGNVFLTGLTGFSGLIFIYQIMSILLILSEKA